MYRLSRFAKNLDIHNCVISTGNWVRYMYIFFGFKNNNNKNELCGYVEGTKLRRFEIVCIRCTDCWICRKFEYPELRKFNGNCVHYMYRLSVLGHM